MSGVRTADTRPLQLMSGRYEMQTGDSSCNRRQVCPARRGRRYPLRPSGMTLIELLIVIAIMSLIIVVIGACLTGAVRVWDAAREFNAAEMEAAVGLTLVEKDLARSLPFFLIKFRGQAKEVSFPCIVRTGPAGSEERIGTVKYYYDATSRSLFRQQWKYPDKEPGRESAERVSTGFEDVTFSYMGDPPGGGAWQQAWAESTNIPRSVKIDILMMKKSAPVMLSRSFVSELTHVTNSTGAMR
ncbi:MAG: hypothetical protein C0404_07450 [Verrucomicrobia bacterium]|nr:hypothetical protein [Verrucomicrobiota bacterium]